MQRNDQIEKNIKYDRFNNNYKQKDLSMSNDFKNVKGFLVGFLAGGTVAAIVTLLTTPKSGKEIRKNIKNKSDEYLDDVDRYYAEKKSKALNIFNEGKRKYSMIMDNIKSKPGEILKDAERVISDTKINSKDVLNSAKDKTENEKYSFKTGIDGNNEKKNS
jgi:gas vesicle protein